MFAGHRLARRRRLASLCGAGVPLGRVSGGARRFPPILRLIRWLWAKFVGDEWYGKDT